MKPGLKAPAPADDPYAPVSQALGAFCGPSERGWSILTAAQRAEILRLTRALHAAQAHPDFTYASTCAATPAPPHAGHGHGWEPNRDHQHHGAGRMPRLSWYWRRRLEGDQT